jgi:hypothetical protein
MKTGTSYAELRLFVFNKNPKNSSLKLLYFFNRDSLSLADLHAAFTTQALIGINRIGLAINHLEHIHWANVYTFLVAIALILVNCYFPHLLVTSSRVELSNFLTLIPLAPHTVVTRFPYPLLCTNHGDTESTEGVFFFARSGAPLAQRDRPLIGQTGNPPEGWDSKRSAEKRSQPSGHDLVTGWLHVNG